MAKAKKKQKPKPLTVKIVDEKTGRAFANIGAQVTMEFSKTNNKIKKLEEAQARQDLEKEQADCSHNPINFTIFRDGSLGFVKCVTCGKRIYKKSRFNAKLRRGRRFYNMFDLS